MYTIPMHPGYNLTLRTDVLGNAREPSGEVRQSPLDRQAACNKGLSPECPAKPSVSLTPTDRWSGVESKKGELPTQMYIAPTPYHSSRAGGRAINQTEKTVTHTCTACTNSNIYLTITKYSPRGGTLGVREPLSVLV